MKSGFINAEVVSRSQSFKVSEIASVETLKHGNVVLSSFYFYILFR